MNQQKMDVFCINNLYNNQNNVTMRKLSLDEMAEINGGMPCWATLAFYGVSFVSLCASTGGLAVLAGISFGGSIWSVFDSCKYELS